MDAEQEPLFPPPVLTTGDGHLHARKTDLWTSHASARKVEAAEGMTFVVRPRTQKYRVLVEYGRAMAAPLTDSQVTSLAGLSSPCPWRRVKDLLDGGFITQVDTVWDSTTNRAVRRCRINGHGAQALEALAHGAKQYP